MFCVTKKKIKKVSLLLILIISMLILLGSLKTYQSSKYGTENWRCSQSYAIYSNDIFCIIFDVRSPRNHLIILAKKTIERHKSVGNLNETELQSFINLVDGFINKINGNRENITLSFHIGKAWVS